MITPPSESSPVTGRENTLLPQGSQQAPVPGTLFSSSACVFWAGRQKAGGGRISSFYCEHNFLTNSFHESLGDLCLFIYLAPSSFLKPRLLRVLRDRTAPVVAMLVALHASRLSSASRNIF